MKIIEIKLPTNHLASKSLNLKNQRPAQVDYDILV